MTHDPREVLEPVLSFLDELAANAAPGKRAVLNPILIGGSAKLYAEGLREALTASPGEQKPAACADWGQLVQCLLRIMDHPHKGENSTEQAERMATELCRKYPAPPAAATPDHGGADAGVVWRSISKDTSWVDGRDVVLLANDMEVQARYCPGEWSDETPSSPREYSGAVWSCFDDQFQLEIEECSKDPSEWGHDGATHWRPISALSKPAPVAANASAEAITEADIRAHVGDGMVSMQNVIDAANAILATRASVEARLREALQQIAAIKNQDYGGDWDEIELARAIALEALSEPLYLSPPPAAGWNEAIEAAKLVVERWSLTTIQTPTIAALLYEAANPTMKWSYLWPSHNHLHASVRQRYIEAAARFEDAFTALATRAQSEDARKKGE